MPPKRKGAPEPGQSTLDSFLKGFKENSKKAKQQQDKEAKTNRGRGRSGSPARQNRAPAVNNSSASASSTSLSSTSSNSTRYSLRGAIAPPPSIYSIEDDPHYKPNFLFYSNQIESKPRGARISYMHANWCTDLHKLEEHHGYIQWLFPLFKSNGMNHHAHCLTKGEAKLIRENRLLANRFITSYKMMLNFYGMKLECQITGKVIRHPSTEFCADRYRNLQYRSHNYLRISRILQSLSHCGFRRWKEPLVRFLFEEIETAKELSNCRGALLEHWIPLLDEDSPEYLKETLELPEDRTDSVYFSQIEAEIRENQKRAPVEIIEDLTNTKHTNVEEEEEAEQFVSRNSSSKKKATLLRRTASDDKTEEIEPADIKEKIEKNK